MPRYYFNLRDAMGDARDEEGIDLADVEAARKAALDGARSIIAEGVYRGNLDLAGAVTVVDEQGATVLVLRYRDAVTPAA